MVNIKEKALTDKNAKCLLLSEDEILKSNKNRFLITHSESNVSEGRQWVLGLGETLKKTECVRLSKDVLISKGDREEQFSGETGLYPDWRPDQTFSGKPCVLANAIPRTTRLLGNGRAAKLQTRNKEHSLFETVQRRRLCRSKMSES